MLLKTSFKAGAIGFCLLFVAVAGVGAMAIQHLRIGSEDYRAIIRDKDLVADILPPPAYVIEAYLETTLALQDAASLPEHKARLAQLHKDYTARLDYWGKADIPADLKSKLQNDSDRPAQQFWREVEGGVLPALGRNDQDAARAHYALAQKAYAEHRAAIDKVVTVATSMDEADEANSVKAGTIYSIVLMAAVAALVAAIAAAVFLMTRKVFVPVDAITETMERLAGGDLDAKSKDDARKDEIGKMARAVNVFRSNALALNAANEEKARLDRLAAEEASRQEALQREAAEKQQFVVDAIGEALTALSAGDLSNRIEAEFPAEYAKLRADFNGAVEKLQ